MKRLVLTVVAGAFGSLLVLPIAHAQDYPDISHDAKPFVMTSAISIRTSGKSAKT